MNCFVQSASNFKVVYLVDRTVLWLEFIVHYAFEIEENSEQILYI